MLQGKQRIPEILSTVEFMRRARARARVKLFTNI